METPKQTKRGTKWFGSPLPEQVDSSPFDDVERADFEDKAPAMEMPSHAHSPDKRQPQTGKQNETKSAEATNATVPPDLSEFESNLVKRAK